ncbi:uncharacterized protein LOC123318580 isoform X2 [Coccinella septempunctata]|uniref:uncharacterized protein LOC123318580 isoform X2 n=1 Tax=Coccinella septempunctata TaxID=41139 RepID=UPI001D09629F|nr:uncharacterized protein LOC123318580 isoform X2 [Coccinella septempunctata]
MIHLTIHHSLKQKCMKKEVLKLLVFQTIQSKIQTLKSPISEVELLVSRSTITEDNPKPQQTGYTSSTQEVEKSQALPEDNPKSQQTGCTDDSMISMNTGPTKVIEDAQTLPGKMNFILRLIKF